MTSIYEHMEAIRTSRETTDDEIIRDAGFMAQGGERLSNVVSSYHADAWKFITDCVWTLDQADKNRPVKPFPTHACRWCRAYQNAIHLGSTTCPTCTRTLEPLDYLEQITHEWEIAEPAILLIPKSRRMRLSWLMVACHTHLALDRRGSAIFFLSSKEEKSAELVARAEHILRNIPDERMHVPAWKPYSKPPMIDFPVLGSQIIGLPEGPDQLRQYTATAILADEIGTWKWPRATYAAMRPCIEGGGRLTLLSSAYPGFWRTFVAGELTGG